MMLKSVCSKMQYVRARSGRNFSCGSEGRGFSEDTKTTLPLWQKIFEGGKKIGCVTCGTASGYALASFVLPNHSEPIREREQRTRAFMKETEEFLIEYHDVIKKLEEERAFLPKL